MRLDGPGQRPEKWRHAAKARMGVNEVVAAEHNQRVVLRRARTREDKVAARHRSARGVKSRPRREIEVSRDGGVAQTVAVRCCHALTKRGGDEADAIEAGHGIAPTQPKWRTRQRLRTGGEAFRAHRGIG